MIIKSATAKTVHNRGLIVTPTTEIRLVRDGLLVTGTNGRNGYYELHRGFTAEQIATIGEVADRAFFLSLSADGDTVLAVSTL